MNNKQLHDNLKEAISTSDWDTMGELRHSINQGFANDSDANGLRSFYDEFADKLLNEEQRSKLTADDSLFRKKIHLALEKVKERVKQLGDIQGVYIEYYYDGYKDESNSANIFLCTKYSEEEDYWGAEFEQEGFIEGAILPDYFYYDPEGEWDTLPNEVAQLFIHGYLFALIIEEWEKNGIAQLPLGFANHDFEMVRIPAKT